MKKLILNLLKKFGYELVLTRNHFPGLNLYSDQKLLMGNQNGLVIFDVGAHHGQTSLTFNSLFNDPHIYSFEPFKDSFDILNESVKSHKNIETFNVALGNVTGKVDFHVNKLSATNSILPTHQDSSKNWGEDLLDTVETIQVDSTSIDDFIEKKGIAQIDILKIDTQGTEYHVIDGAKKAIQQDKIKLIFLEIITLPTYQNQKYLDEMLSFLRANGFNLYNFYNFSYTQYGVLRQMDAIFLSNKFQFKPSHNKGYDQRGY